MISMAAFMLAFCSCGVWAFSLEKMRDWSNTKRYSVLSHDLLRKTDSKLVFPLVSVESNMLDSLVLIVADGNDKSIQAQAAEIVRTMVSEKEMVRVLDVRGSDDVQIVFAHSAPDADHYDKMLIWGSKRGSVRGREYTIVYIEGEISVKNLQLNSTIFPDSSF